MKKYIVVFILFICYYLLFWKHAIGLNLLLFQSIIYGIMIAFQPVKLKSKYFLLALFGSICGGVFMVIHNSSTALWLSIFSHLILLGFYFQTQLKTINNSLFTGVIQLLSGIESMIEIRKSVPRKEAIGKYSKKVIKIIVLPILMILFFYVVYRIANPDFNSYMLKINEGFADFFNNLFKNFSITWIAFTFFGLLISFSALFNQNIILFANKESSKNSTLEHELNDAPLKRILVWLNSKEEFYSAVFVLITVNLLLLMVNYFDFKAVWLEPESLIDSKRAMQYIVHSGTYVLIGSILMAMGMLLYIFKGRQNFFKLNLATKSLAYFWLFQNAFLVGSVLIRNAVYIQYYGVAYKRIGVYIFLTLTLFGLATLCYKIFKNKSAFYLVRWNGIFAFIMFIAIAFVDWDSFIVKHNISNKHIENIDARFLLSRSDKTLPLFLEHPSFLEYYDGKKIKKSRYGSYQYADSIFRERIADFKKKKEKQNWRSWNWAESKALKKINSSK